MRLRFLYLVFFFSTGLARSQSWPFELWHEGKIVLLDGDTLKGFVKYNLQQDLVQYNLADKVVEAYTARKILFFEIFDSTIHKYRQFYALPFASATGYKAPVFFELLAEGKLTLLTREALEYRTYNSPYFIGSYSRQVMVYKFFFLDEKGDIQEFTGSKNDFLTMMGKKSEAVEKYMKSNKLKYDDRYDVAKIVNYYNSLFGN